MTDNEKIIFMKKYVNPDELFKTMIVDSDYLFLYRYHTFPFWFRKILYDYNKKIANFVYFKIIDTEMGNNKYIKIPNIREYKIIKKMIKFADRRYCKALLMGYYQEQNIFL